MDKTNTAFAVCDETKEKAEPEREHTSRLSLAKGNKKDILSFHCKDVNPCKTQDFKTNKIGMYFKIC